MATRVEQLPELPDFGLEIATKADLRMKLGEASQRSRPLDKRVRAFKTVEISLLSDATDESQEYYELLRDTYKGTSEIYIDIANRLSERNQFVKAKIFETHALGYSRRADTVERDHLW